MASTHDNLISGEAVVAVVVEVLVVSPHPYAKARTASGRYFIIMGKDFGTFSSRF